MNVDTQSMLVRLPAILGLRRDPSRMSSLMLLPLRLFFGATFVYAGLQKLTDPQFFSATAPGFIGHQMTGFVRAGCRSQA
jgi:thiosulfate dehydrogenase [quinone] large subunit